jgi:hypothetical protein
MLPWLNNTPDQIRPRRLDTKGLGRLVVILLMLFWFSLLGLAAINRQNIIDWWQLRNYQTPAVVSQLARQDEMTSYAQKIFYVNHPVISDKAAFPKTCPNNGDEKTIVLGCYHGNQAGIYLLTVTDPRLDGVQQVTAAHEMLHAAYDRLSSGDRNEIDAELMNFYKHDLKDSRILATIAAYKKSEPNDLVNEMHSVFGSEVPNLPGNLEHYYSRYFTDRSKVTSFAASYQAEFTSRQTAVANSDVQLATMKAQITATETDLQTKQATITAQQSQLLSLKNSGDLKSYNAGVAPYNKLIDTYNSEVDSLKALVDRYNQLVVSRNATALEQDQLVNELTTNAKQINH